MENNTSQKVCDRGWLWYTSKFSVTTLPPQAKGRALAGLLGEHLQGKAGLVEVLIINICPLLNSCLKPEKAKLSSTHIRLSSLSTIYCLSQF